MGGDLIDPAFDGEPRHFRRRGGRQREHQEQITGLGDGGVGHQHLEPGLGQRPERTPENRPHAQPAQRLGRQGSDQFVKGAEPQAQQQIERGFDHQGGQQGAHRRRRTAMGRRQPDMKGKQGGFEQHPQHHQPRRQLGGRQRLDQVAEQFQRYRAVGSIKQGHAHQIGPGTQQGGQQIAQCGGDRRPVPVDGDQRHGGQPEQFQGDVEVKDVGGQEQRIQSRRQKAGQRPESGGEARTGRKVASGINRDHEGDHGREQQHEGGQAIRRQFDAQRRAPAADGVAARAVFGDLHRQQQRQRDLGERGRQPQRRARAGTAQKGQRRPEQRQQDQPGQGIENEGHVSR